MSGQIGYAGMEIMKHSCISNTKQCLLCLSSSWMAAHMSPKSGELDRGRGTQEKWGGGQEVLQKWEKRGWEVAGCRRNSKKITQYWAYNIGSQQ